MNQPRETFAGLKEDLIFPLGELRLGRGDTLLLYSDGVTEMRDRNGDELEYAGLRQRFAQAVEEEQCQHLIERMARSLREYQGEVPQADDITLLAFRYWGPGGQKAPQSRDYSSVRMVLGGSARDKAVETGSQ